MQKDRCAAFESFGDGHFQPRSHLSWPWHGWCGAAALLALITGCASHQPRFDEHAVFSDPTAQLNSVTITNQLTPDLLKPVNELYTLGPGDSIEIETLGNPLSRVITPVGLDGKIYYSLLPGLDVWGLTLEQARERLEKELANYLRSPQVVLTLRTVGSKHFWLLGRVNRPGIYPLTGSVTLLESLAMAGGSLRSTSTSSTTEELADLRHSFVIRQGQFLPVDFYRLLRDGDTSQNIILRPDDYVYVPSALANEVYVLGAVHFPRIVPFVEKMTLVTAIAGTSGPERLNFLSPSDGGPFMKDAYVSHVAIVRGSLTEPKLSVVDYQDIVKGRAPDVLLEPGDIVYVPNSPYTTLKRYVNLIVNTFVSTVAANEGIHAGGQNNGVNVAIPVSVPVAVPPAAR